MAVAITGAASGIGAALARRLASAGERLALIDRDGAALERLGLDGALLLPCDVGDEAAMRAAFAEIAAAFGRLDGLATCAGVVDTTPFAALDAARFRAIHEVNVVGTFLALREGAAIAAEGARFVTVASISGLRGGGLFGTAAYAASKGAVLALTKSAARELGPRGIAVNCVAPGPTDTAMTAPVMGGDARAGVAAATALGRVADAGEIAAAIAFLLSREASFVTGATLVADGGIAMA